MIEYTLSTCPRCGGAHKGLKFKPLQKAPTKANHWAVCPATKEPIMAVVTLETAEQWGGPDDTMDRPRTKAEVLAAQGTPGGCCDAHANNSGCDCLAKAT